MAEEYVPFEEALKSLKLSEAELKRLVSEDQIQAVRDARGKVRLRKSDVDLIGGRGGAELVEELVFADDDLGDDTGMATAVLEEDSLLEEEDTLDLAPEELEVEEAPRRRRNAPAAVAPVRSKGRASAIRKQDDNEEESTLDKVLLIATAVVLLYALFFAYSISQGESTAMTAWLSDMFDVK